MKIPIYHSSDLHQQQRWKNSNISSSSKQRGVVQQTEQRKSLCSSLVCIFLCLFLISAAIFLLNVGGSNEIDLTTFYKKFSVKQLRTADIVEPGVLAATKPLPVAVTTIVTTTAVATEVAGATIELPNPIQKSKNLYVTLISGIDSSFRYRGFLYNTLIMKQALVAAGSTADFMALIGFKDKDTAPFQEDMNLLKSHGIIIYLLPRWVHTDHELSFAEMALLKIVPWSFVQYDKIQFFDGDVMPKQNMDCLFDLPQNTFTIGAVSPLNSGWYLAIPNMEAFEAMREKAIWRLGRDWDKRAGWAEEMPSAMTVRGGRPCKVGGCRCR